MMKKNAVRWLFAFYLTYLLGSWAVAQTSVSGKVLDEGRRPLPGVTVTVEGSASRTVTDLDGGFSISTQQPSPVRLTFSFRGYSTQTVSVSDGGRASVTLREQAKGSGRKYVPIRGNRSAFQRARAFSAGFELGIGIHGIGFLNSHFARQRANDAFSGGESGFTLHGRLIYYPFLVDARFMTARFTVEPGASPQWPYPEPVDAIQRGGEGSVSLALLPTSKRFTPFAGVGYRGTTLGTDEEEATRIDTSGAIWKFGLIYISKRFSASFEYKQDIDIDSPTALAQASLGVAYRFPFNK